MLPGRDEEIRIRSSREVRGLSSCGLFVRFLREKSGEGERERGRRTHHHADDASPSSVPLPLAGERTRAGGGRVLLKSWLLDFGSCCLFRGGDGFIFFFWGR